MLCVVYKSIRDAIFHVSAVINEKMNSGHVDGSVALNVIFCASVVCFGCKFTCTDRCSHLLYIHSEYAGIRQCRGPINFKNKNEKKLTESLLRDRN